MKYFFGFIVSVCFSLSVSAQNADSIVLPPGAITPSNLSPATSPVRPVDRPVVQKARGVRPGIVMRNIGKGVTFGGLGIFALGLIVHNSKPDPNSYTTYTVDDYKTIGTITMVEGAAFFITGIILWSKGQAKFDAYQVSQQKLKIGFTGKQATIRYRF